MSNQIHSLLHGQSSSEQPSSQDGTGYVIKLGDKSVTYTESGCGIRKLFQHLLCQAVFCCRLNFRQGDLQVLHDDHIAESTLLATA